MVKKILRIRTILILVIVGFILGKSKIFLKEIAPLTNALSKHLTATNIKIFIACLVIITLMLVINKMWNFMSKIRRNKKQQAAITALMPSDDRQQYIISRDDYRRGNSKENFYRKTFYLYLLETFGNSCARCGDKENGMDIDHFIFGKNEGGCFIMQHKDGYFVNNAIPLCQTCNRSKSDNNYRDFFDDEELLSILQHNLLMTKLLNERLFWENEGKFIKQKKVV